MHRNSSMAHPDKQGKIPLLALFFSFLYAVLVAATLFSGGHFAVSY